MCILYECMNNIQVVFLAGSCCGCFSKVCQSELRWIGHRLLTCLSLKSTPLTLASWKKQAGQSGEKKEGQEGERRSQLLSRLLPFPFTPRLVHPPNKKEERSKKRNLEKIRRNRKQVAPLPFDLQPLCSVDWIRFAFSATVNSTSRR